MTCKRFLLTVVTATVIAITAAARILPGTTIYKVRLGYNIGGTMPIGMPATIRSLNSYTLQGNLLLGFDVQNNFNSRWAVLTGIRLERKAMKIDATVKNYHTSIVRGGESLTGYYTGDNESCADQQMLTIPVQAVLRLGERVELKLGPYVSFLTTRTFNGYVHNGYLREGDPTGQKVVMGDDEETRATYDFSGDMRHVLWGMDFGIDCNVYRRWGVYADLSWGLNGIFKRSFNTIEQTLYPIYGSIGLTYKL